MLKKSKMSDNTTTPKFRDWINTVPVGIYPKVRSEIISRCAISNYVFSNWLGAKSKVPFLAQKEIKKIAKENKLTEPFKEIA